MNKEVKHLVGDLKKHIIKIYGSKIKQVILYGSYVRNEETAESDIDVLVVVDNSLNPFEVRKNLSDLLFDILLEKGHLISVTVIPESLFKGYNTPFLLNIKEEGLVI